MPIKTIKPSPIAWHGPVLLDTCAWLWLVHGHQRLLEAQCRAGVEAAAYDERLFLAPISMWEVAMKAAKGKLILSTPTLEWIEVGKKRSRIEDAPMTATIAVESASLPGACPSDPADRLIIATARSLDAVLVTGDERILSYAKAGFVRAWPV